MLACTRALGQVQGHWQSFGAWSFVQTVLEHLGCQEASMLPM